MSSVKRYFSIRHIAWMSCVIILALLVSACGATAASTPSGGAATSTPAAPNVGSGTPSSLATLPASNTIQPALTQVPQDTFAILRQTGGLAPVNQMIVIKRDGTVVSGSTQKRAPGGSAAINTLMDKTNATGIYGLKPGPYLPTASCCDRQTVELTLVKDGKAYTYSTANSDTAPAPLKDSLKLINDYIDSAQ